MDVNWRKGFDQSAVLDRLFELAKQQQIHRHDAESLVIFTVLRSMLEFPEDLSSETRLELIAQGAEAAIKAKDTDFLRHLRTAAKAFNKKPLVTYVMYTSITVTVDSLLTSTKVGDVSIRFLKSMPKAVKAERQKLFDQNDHWLPVAHEPSMKVIRAEVQARASEDAAEKCLAAIDLLRGIWNHLKTPPWRMTINGPRRPLNTVFLGPIHTFHKPSGELESEQFWYEPSLQRDTTLVQLDGQAAGLLKASAKVRAKLRKHAYAADIENAFVRYARAMDTIDHDVTIQKLWGLLEFLTETGLASYDKTVRRTRFLYDEERFAAQVLEHLRLYRNRSVHGGYTAGNVESEVYQLKRYVDAMLRYHLINSYRFASMAQACEMLDLPPEAPQLKSRLNLTLNAMKFRQVSR